MSQHQSELDMVSKGNQLGLDGKETTIKTTGEKVDSSQVGNRSDGYDTVKEVRAGRQEQLVEKEIKIEPEDERQETFRRWTNKQD